MTAIVKVVAFLTTTQRRTQVRAAYRADAVGITLERGDIIEGLAINEWHVCDEFVDHEAAIVQVNKLVNLGGNFLLDGSTITIHAHDTGGVRPCVVSDQWVKANNTLTKVI